MEPRLLFPAKFRYLGYLLALPGFTLGYLKLRDNELLNSLIKNAGIPEVFEHYADEAGLIFLILGLLFIAFARLKHEDELTAKIRIYALYWAIVANYALYVVVLLFIIAGALFNVNMGGGLFGPYVYLIGFSELFLFTPLLLFVAIFYYVLLRNRNEFVVRPMQYLPNKPYRYLGKWLSILSIAALIINACLQTEVEALQLPVLLLPITMLIWAYSKEKAEDEFVSNLRLEAMQVAVYVNYVILIITTLAVYGIRFWTVQYIELIAIPAIFIIWFQYKLYRTDQQTETKPFAS